MVFANVQVAFRDQFVALKTVIMFIFVSFLNLFTFKRTLCVKELLARMMVFALFEIQMDHSKLSVSVDMELGEIIVN